MKAKLWTIKNGWQQRQYANGRRAFYHNGERTGKRNFEIAFHRQQTARIKSGGQPGKFLLSTLKDREALAKTILADFDKQKAKLTTKKFTEVRIVMETKTPRGKKWKVSKFKSIRKFERFLGLDDRYKLNDEMPVWKRTKRGIGKLRKRVYISIPKLRGARETGQKILAEYEIF